MNNNSLLNSNTILDSSGNNYHGTVTTATLNTTAGFNSGGALDFNGTSGYVALNQPVIPTDGNFSIATWIYIRDRGEAYYGEIFDDGELIIRCHKYTPTRSIRVSMNGGTNVTYESSHSNMCSGGAYADWYHLVINYFDDTNTSQIIVNGDMITTGYTGDYVAQSHNPYIGNNNADSRTWNGLIDDFRIYNRALSESEVMGLYQQRSEVKPSQLYQKDIKTNSTGVYVRNGFSGSCANNTALTVVGGIITGCS